MRNIAALGRPKKGIIKKGITGAVIKYGVGNISSLILIKQASKTLHHLASYIFDPIQKSGKSV